MTTRRLILAGGTVCFAAIGVAKRYRRPAKDTTNHARTLSPVALPAIYLTLAGPLSTWSPSWLYNEFFGWLGVLIDPIKDFVISVGNWVGNRVTDLLNAVEHAWNESWEALTATVNRTADLAAKGLSAVGGVITDTYAMLDDAFRNFRDQAKAMLEAAYNTVEDAITDKLPDLIRAVFGDVVDLFGILVDIGVGGFATLLNFLTDPIGFLWDLVGPLVDDAIGVALDAAQFGFDAMWALFWTTLQTVLGVPENPLDVLKGAWWAIQMAYYLATGDVDKIANDLLPDAVDYFEKEIRRLIGQEQFKIEQWVGMAQGAGHATDGAIQ